jgi:hypothetical protein
VDHERVAAPVGGKYKAAFMINTVNAPRIHSQERLPGRALWTAYPLNVKIHNIHYFREGEQPE